jgi:hypothetical protein
MPLSSILKCNLKRVKVIRFVDLFCRNYIYDLEVDLHVDHVLIVSFNSLMRDGDFCHRGWDTEIAPGQKFKIVETQCHDHSLESS